MIFPTATDATSTATATTGQAGAPVPASNQMDRDMFLKLMVAQLRNQDPMNPTDSTEFLAQTAQFTSLEKLEEVASQTAQALSAQMAFGASSLVGRTVTYLGPDGTETTGTVDSVRFTADGPMLGIEDIDIRMNDVVAVGGDAA